MSVQHQGPCAVSIRELWQQIEEMKATIAELKTTLRNERVNCDQLEPEWVMVCRSITCTGM